MYPREARAEIGRCRLPERLAEPRVPIEMDLGHASSVADPPGSADVALGAQIIAPASNLGDQVQREIVPSCSILGSLWGQELDLRKDWIV